MPKNDNKKNQIDQIGKLKEFFRKTTRSLSSREITQISEAEILLKKADWDVEKAAEEHEKLIDEALGRNKRRKKSGPSSGLNL